jgi:hypothetical protein
MKSNSTVAHNWAHGVIGKGSNLTTDGKRLISYNTDIAFNTGRGLVFMSADSMSPSTGRHLTYARRACSHLDVILSPIFTRGSRFYDFDENRALKMTCEALNAELASLSIAKLSKYLHSNIMSALNKIVALESVARKYNLPAFQFSHVPAEKIEAARVYCEQFAAKQRERDAARKLREIAANEARRAQDADQFATWRAGSGACPASYRANPAGGYYIAVHGDKVVTSGGAECPTEHARRAVEFWASREIDSTNTFEPWARNGHTIKLGVFQLDRIEADGSARAGCHLFICEELERLADILL